MSRTKAFILGALATLVIGYGARYRARRRVEGS